MILIVMGVSGSGKTTIGMLLAERENCEFADGDDYHPQANKDKMKSGHPLNDEDRQPWLERLNELMLGWQADGKGGVLACSALKQSYRGTLSKGLSDAELRFVFLDLSKDMLAKRLAERKHEFMDPNLLETQLQTLEAPADAIRVVNDRTPAEVVTEIEAKLHAAS